MRALVIAGAVTIVVAAVISQARSAGAQPGQVLEGSWMTDVTNLETGARQITLYTFMSDGTLISSNKDHPVRGPAHGAWVRTGDREFAVTFVRLRFDTDGNFIGTQKLRAQFTLHATLDEFTSQSQNEFFGVDGNFETSNMTTGLARRIKVEPLP